MGSGIRFDETETDIGTCFSIRLVVSVALYIPSLMQIDSKSKTAKFLNNFCSSLYGILKESNFSKRVSPNWYTLFGKICLTRSLHVIKCRSKIPAFEKIV